jgi:hypothetical protein
MVVGVADDVAIPDIEVGRCALRSFRWSVEPVEPKFKEYLDGLPPSPPPPPEEPGDPPYPPPVPPLSLGVSRFSVEFEPPVLAVRLGWWDDGAVRVWRSPSYSRSGDWEDGTCRAVCAIGSRRIIGGKLVRVEPHDAPHEGCSCGIYGSLSYADLIQQFRSNVKNIVAVIAAEGATIIGDRGLRTAFARVVAYWVTPDPIYRHVAAAQFKNAELYGSPLEMAEAYGIALLPPTSAKDSRVGSDWWTGGRVRDE